MKNNKSSKEKSTPNKKETKLTKTSILYLIIAVLAAIIILRIIFIVLERGKETVQIESFAPSGEVQQTTNFTITFSKEVVKDSLVNVWLDEAPVTFNPEIPGKFQWIDRDKIRFYPNVPLRPSTGYTADVSPRLVSNYGFSAN